MGATGWSYFTDWCDDAGEALNKCRREVFAKGQYQLKKRLVSGYVPQTIEEALKIAGESGTHSILDISNGTASHPLAGAAIPASAATLDDIYGTAIPTRAMVEEQGFPPASLLGRWTAVYFPVAETQGGKPRWWFFEVS